MSFNAEMERRDRAEIVLMDDRPARMPAPRAWAWSSGLRDAEPHNDLLRRMDHELRTPLNAIVGFAQLLESRDASAPAGQRWVAMIEQAGRHMLSVLDDMLLVSQQESEPVQGVPVTLAGPIEVCVAMVSEAAAPLGITISTDVADNAQMALADVVRLRQVLINLLSNAIKYNRDGGRVVVRTCALDLGMVAIQVSDTGLGMTAVQLDSLFQPFNRLGREHSGIEGNGIGLVIAKRLVEEMGGSLRACSVAGRGSTFTITLPASRQSDAAGRPFSTRRRP